MRELTIPRYQGKFQAIQSKQSASTSTVRLADIVLSTEKLIHGQKIVYMLLTYDKSKLSRMPRYACQLKLYNSLDGAQDRYIECPQTSHGNILKEGMREGGDKLLYLFLPPTLF